MNLTTKRLALRPMTQSDAPALFAILGDPDDERVPVVAPRLAGAAGLPAQASE